MLNGFVRIFLRNIPPTSKCNYSENFNVTTLNAVRKSTKKPFQLTPLKTNTVYTELFFFVLLHSRKSDDLYSRYLEVKKVNWHLTRSFIVVSTKDVKPPLPPPRTSSSGFSNYYFYTNS